MYPPDVGYDYFAVWIADDSGLYDSDDLLYEHYDDAPNTTTIRMTDRKHHGHAYIKCDIREM